MFPTITYDRSARQYRVQDTTTGEIEVFPAGCKIEAQRYAVAMSNPRLTRIIREELLEKRPFLEARAWKAAEIVLNDDVAPADGLYFAYVAGSNDTYALGHDADGLMTCTCPDFTGFGAPIVDTRGQRLCKHLLAWQLFQRLQKRRCYHCGRLVDADAMDCPLCGEAITPY